MHAGKVLDDWWRLSEIQPQPVQLREGLPITAGYVARALVGPHDFHHPSGLCPSQPILNHVLYLLHRCAIVVTAVAVMLLIQCFQADLDELFCFPYCSFQAVKLTCTPAHTKH